MSWPRPNSLKTPATPTTSWGGTNEGYLFANFTNVASLTKPQGFTMVAYARINSPLPNNNGRIFTWFKTQSETCYIGVQQTSDQLTNVPNFIYSTNSGKIGHSASALFPNDEFFCIAAVVDSASVVSNSYAVISLYANGGLYSETEAKSCSVIYPPNSCFMFVNHAQNCPFEISCAAFIGGPISSADASFLSRHPPSEFSQVTSHDVYYWYFDSLGPRFPERNQLGGTARDFFISTNVTTPFLLSNTSHFWPEYFVRLHNQSSDGQIVVNSVNDVMLTDYVTHVSIARNVSNLFQPPRVGVAQIMMTDVTTGFTPWTQDKLREDGGISVTAFYGGSLHVLFAGYIKNMSVQRGPAAQLSAVIAAHDSVGMFRREYISERYRQDTVVNSYFSEVVSGGPKRTYSSITAIGVNIPLIYTKDARSIDETLGRFASFYNPWVWLGYRVNSNAGSLSLINVLRAEPHSYAISTTAADTITEFFGLSARTDTENIINKFDITIHPRESALSQVNSGAGITLPIQISAQSTIRLWFYHSDAANAEWDGIPGEVQSTFTNTTHYIFNTKSDNSGSNMSANLSIVATSYGVKGLYIISNSNANSAGYLTKFITQPRVFRTRGKGVVTRESTTSQNSYGLRQIGISDNIWHQIEADTGSFAAYMIDRYKSPIETTGVTLKSWPHCFYNVGAVVSLVDTLANINGKYIIASVDYDISLERGKSQTLRIEAEKHV